MNSCEGWIPSHTWESLDLPRVHHAFLAQRKGVTQLQKELPLVPAWYTLLHLVRLQNGVYFLDQDILILKLWITYLF